MGATDQTKGPDLAVDGKPNQAALERIVALPWDRPDTPRRTETHIRFEQPQVAVRFEPLPSDPEARKKALAQFGDLASPETLSELEASEKQIAGWLGSSPDNAIRIAAD